MKYKVNGLEVITDDVTDRALRREHEANSGKFFPLFLERLVEEILDAYDYLIGDGELLSIELFDYKYWNFGITFNFADGWTFTIDPER